MARCLPRLALLGFLTLLVSAASGDRVLFQSSQTRSLSATGTAYSLAATAPGFGVFSDSVAGTGGVGTEPTVPWSAESSDASQVSLAVSSPVFSVSTVNAGTEADSAAAQSAGNAHFEFVFTLIAPHTYSAIGNMGATLNLAGTGSGLARTTVSLDQSGVGAVFSDSIEFTTTGGATPDVLHVGILPAGLYTFTVDSQCNASVLSGAGEATAFARHNVTLTVPEPATVGMLAMGGLAGLLRRRRRQ